MTLIRGENPGETGIVMSFSVRGGDCREFPPPLELFCADLAQLNESFSFDVKLPGIFHVAAGWPNSVLV